MKKYSYCFFLCIILCVVILGSAVWWFWGRVQRGEEAPVLEETMQEAPESETVAEDRIVLNQENILPVAEERDKLQSEEVQEEMEELEKEKKEYLLVSEDGFLLVFGNNAREICLYTHIPITDFPEEEREKLRQGIWFSRMEEIYNYLESYTS